MKVGHLLAAALERVEEAGGAAGANQLRAAFHLDHRQPSTGRGDRVCFTSLRLLPLA